MTKIITCEWCGAQNEVPNHSKNRFCGRSCSAKWRMRQPEMIAINKSPQKSKKISEKLKEAHARNPDWAKKASKRMRENNPSHDPDVLAKTREYWKEHGHPLKKQQLKGGNGKVLPFAHRILWAALGPEWKTEYVIATKQPRGSGYPSNYKVDLAFPSLKMWVEVDGWGHSVEEGKLLDKKKTDLLRTLGWTGLRFWNHQIENQLPRITSIICKFRDTLHISQKGS